MNKRSPGLDHRRPPLEIIGRHRKLLFLGDVGSSEGYHATQKKYVYSGSSKGSALLDPAWTGQLFENYSNLSAFFLSFFASLSKRTLFHTRASLSPSTPREWVNLFDKPMRFHPLPPFLFYLLNSP